jgi:putative transcriptional regulator
MEHEAVGNNLRERRARQGLTQAQLAELTGVSRISIVSIENGRFIPTIETALRIGEPWGFPPMKFSG